MKRNKTMRTAAVLGAAALLTTGAVTGTLAKYTTMNSGTDSATVAKFGVKINVNDDMGLFKTEYAKDDEDATSANTVVTATADQRKIAPGTKGSMNFSISGKPEVATKFAVNISDMSAVHLDAGSYELKAGKFAEKDCKVTTEFVYEPIKWYFGEQNPDTEDVAYNLTLTGDTNSLQKNLESLTKEYEPNQDLKKTYYIGWKWDFEPVTDFAGNWSYNNTAMMPYTGAKIANFLDTYLGDETNLQTEAFKLQISVTQVD